MKAIEVKQLDSNDEEIVDALIILGMSRNVAKTLAYLRNVNEAQSTDLETGTNLRQPEVSIVMMQLKECDWIKEREDKKPGKGRPLKIYSLKVGFNKIIAQLETERKKADVEAQEKIERLKKLGK